MTKYIFEYISGFEEEKSNLLFSAFKIELVALLVIFKVSSGLII